MLRRRNWLIKKLLIEDIKAASHRAKGILLDIGCGDKPYQYIFRTKIRRYIGVDVPSNIHRPNESIRHSKIDIYASGMSLPIHSKAVDTVVSFQVLEHVTEPDLVISEASRILKTGGCLILSAPHQWQLHEEPFDFYRFTKYGLKNLLERHNFRVEYIKPQGGFWAMLGQKLAYYISSSWRTETPLNYLVMLLYTAILVVSEKIDRYQSIEDETMNYLLLAEKQESS